MLFIVNMLFFHAVILKGLLRLFNVGLYEILPDSLCVTFSGWQSAHPQFEGPDRVDCCTEGQQQNVF